MNATNPDHRHGDLVTALFAAALNGDHHAEHDLGDLAVHDDRADAFAHWPTPTPRTSPVRRPRRRSPRQTEGIVRPRGEKEDLRQTLEENLVRAVDGQLPRPRRLAALGGLGEVGVLQRVPQDIVEREAVGIDLGEGRVPTVDPQTSPRRQRWTSSVRGPTRRQARLMKVLPYKRA